MRSHFNHFEVSTEHCMACELLNTEGGNRMLFKLHDHILHQIPYDCKGDEQVLETSRMQSRAALHAATKMVVEIAQAHENASSSAFSLFTIAPSYMYLIRVGLKNIQEQIVEEKSAWLEIAEGRLRSELGRFET